VRKRVTVDTSLNKAIELSVKNIGHSEMGRDFALVTLDAIKFIIARVPNSFGPGWSRNICVEYRKEFGPIPDSEKREAISEIVSFVLGTQLLNAGFTEYDHEWQTLTLFAKTSWGGAYSRSVSEGIPISPVNLGIRSFIIKEEKIEELLCGLIPKYLDLRDKRRLKEALWRYWISRDTPPGADLPVLSSALEIIMKAWFDSEESKSTKFYMPQKEFNKLIGEGLKNIEGKLDEYIENKTKSLEQGNTDLLEIQEIKELKNTVIGKVRNSNQKSLTKQYPAFFKGIGLKTGEIEDGAIRARNQMAHGDNDNNGKEEESEKERMYTYAYQTLFHRVFLKLLGYEGNYVDRSVIGFPEKHINSLLGNYE
jgi:hypothetical protein